MYLVSIIKRKNSNAKKSSRVPSTSAFLYNTLKTFIMKVRKEKAWGNLEKSFWRDS